MRVFWCWGKKQIFCKNEKKWWYIDHWPETNFFLYGRSPTDWRGFEQGHVAVDSKAGRKTTFTSINMDDMSVWGQQRRCRWLPHAGTHFPLQMPGNRGSDTLKRRVRVHVCCAGRAVMRGDQAWHKQCGASACLSNLYTQTLTGWIAPRLNHLHGLRLSLAFCSHASNQMQFSRNGICTKSSFFPTFGCVNTNH